MNFFWACLILSISLKAFAMESPKQKNSMRTLSMPSCGGSTSSNGSPRTFSPSGSPRKVRHCLFILDPKYIFSKRLELFLEGEANKETLIKYLKEYNVEVLLAIDSSDLDKLDEECSNEIEKIFKDLNITCDINYPKTSEQFFTMMEQYSKKTLSHLRLMKTEQNNTTKIIDAEQQLKDNELINAINNFSQKSIVFYGLSNNKLVYIRLCQLCIPLFIETAAKNNETITLNALTFPFNELIHTKHGQAIIISCITDRTYSRVFNTENRRNFYLSEEDDKGLKTYCAQCLELLECIEK